MTYSAFGEILSDAACFSIDVAEAYSGTGTATAGAGRMFVGSNTPSGDDSGVCVGRNVVGTNLFSHAFRDESDFQSATTGAYCAFDADYDAEGTLGYAHLYGFQCRADHKSSGTCTIYVGFVSAPVVSAGTVTSVNGFRVYNATGAGTVTNQYGLYIENLTKGVTVNYAIYSAGSAPSYVGGNWQVGGSVITTGTVTGSNLKGTEARQEVCVGFSVGSGGYFNTVVGYQAGQGIQADAQYNCLFGRHAGNDVTTGDRNIFIGGLAGDNCTTGSDNIVIAYDVNTPAVGTNNYLNIGNLIVGDTGATKKIHLYGGTAAAQAAKINDPAGGGTVDAEARTAINAIIDALEAIGISAAS